MTVALVTPVELDGLSCQKSSHDRTDRRKPCAQQQMGMIGDQSPCKTISMCLGQYLSESVDKCVTIGIVPENFPAFGFHALLYGAALPGHLFLLSVTYLLN